MRLVVLAEYIVMMLIGVIREFHVAASGSASIQRVSGLEDLSWVMFSNSRGTWPRPLLSAAGCYAWECPHAFR